MLESDSLESMPIPEDRLKAWAAQGPAAAAQSTCAALRDALVTDIRSLIYAQKTDFYPCGSYHDGTNTGGEGPADAAVVLTSAWSQDLAMGGASVDELRRLQDAFQNFRLDVLGTLRAKYGLASVEDRPEGLFVEGAAGRVPMNLLVGIQHRLFLNFASASGKQYREGLCFWDPDGRQVVRFPKLHHENGEAKDGEAGTKGWFKPLVRLFKGLRGHLVEREILDPALAPSYFLECLVYNVPNQHFGWSLADSLAGALKWLSTSPLAGLKAQNGIDPLFGSGPGQWSDKHARLFLATVVRAWNSWPPAAQ